MKQQVSFLIIFASTAKKQLFSAFQPLFFKKHSKSSSLFLKFFSITGKKKLNILPSFVRNFSKNILSSPLDLFTLASYRLFFHP